MMNQCSWSTSQCTKQWWTVWTCGWPPCFICSQSYYLHSISLNNKS